MEEKAHDSQALVEYDKMHEFLEKSWANMAEMVKEDNHDLEGSLNDGFMLMA